MKRNLFLLTAAIAFSTSAIFAQTVVKENINGEQTIEQKKLESDKSVDARYSGVEANFNFVDSGFTYGMTMIFNKFFINSDYLSFYDDPQGVTTNTWNIGAGYNYRHFFSKGLYIDGRAGVQYSNTKIEYSGSYKSLDDYNNGTFDLFVMPKIGLRITSGFAITAGYKITFVDCNNAGGNLNLGLSFLL